MKDKILDKYEELLIYTEEVRDSLDLIHNWLARRVDPEDYWSYHNLIALHKPNLALLNLTMYRLDDLIAEHQQSIEDFLKQNEVKQND